MANFWEKDQPLAAPPPAQSAPAGNFWERDAVAEKPVEAWNPALGLSRDVVNGIPVLGPLYTGAVDAVSTQLMGLITGEDPEALRERVYAKQSAYEDENPVLSTVGQIAGGTAAMAPLGMTAAGAKALGIAPGQSLLSRLGMGGMSGGVIAGADSLARGNEMQEAGLTALGGTAIGAAGGAAAPAIGRGMSRMGEFARQKLGMPSSTDVGLSRPAADILTRAMDADGSLGNVAAQNMSAAGPRAMFADAGPNTMSLLDTAIQRSGPASRMASAAVDERAMAANADIDQALSRVLGEPQGVHSAGQNLRTSTASARSSAYDAAYASPIDYSSDAGRAIEGLVNRVPKSVVDRANLLMQLDGRQSKQIMAQIGEDGSVTYMRMPDVEQLDYITRALNTAANSTEGQGALGGMTDIGRAYSSLSRDLRGATRQAAPTYAEALETAAQPIQQRQALEFGSKLLSPTMARDEAADIIGAMSGPERQYAKQGVRSQFDEAIANVRAVASDPNIDARQAKKAVQDLSSPAAREKLSVLLGKSEADTLFAQLDQAAKSLELRANVATNSRTFARQSMDEAVNAHINDGAWNQALQGKVGGTAQSVVQALTGRDAKGRQAISDKVYAEIASMLVGNPETAMNIISGLGARRALAKQPRMGAALVPGSANATTRQIAEMISGRVSQ